MAQHRLNYHHLISQSAVSAAGSPLANAVVDAQSQLYYPVSAGVPPRLPRVRRLSMLRYFLRKQGIRDLSLPAAVLRAGRECSSLPGSFPQPRGPSLPRVVG
jgi:hypothetical protein